jgi:short-subunit dehydrogenase
LWQSRPEPVAGYRISLDFFAFGIKMGINMKRYSLDGKHILITGASGGLGSALVKLMARQNVRLAVTSRSQTALEELISSLPQPQKAISIIADLAKPGEAGRLVDETLSALGRIDVLINNAGVGYFATMSEASEEHIRHLFEVNTLSPLMLIKTLLPHMHRNGGGRVINILSCAGRVPIPSAGV